MYLDDIINSNILCYMILQNRSVTNIQIYIKKGCFKILKNVKHP